MWPQRLNAVSRTNLVFKNGNGDIEENQGDAIFDVANVQTGVVNFGNQKSKMTTRKSKAEVVKSGDFSLTQATAEDAAKRYYMAVDVEMRAGLTTTHLSKKWAVSRQTAKRWRDECDALTLASLPAPQPSLRVINGSAYDEADRHTA
jgi:hypothetical protein